MPRYMGPMPTQETSLELDPGPETDAQKKHQQIATRIGEIDCMRDIAAIFESMPEDVQQRVAAWVFARYGALPVKMGPPSNPPPIPPLPWRIEPPPTEPYVGSSAYMCPPPMWAQRLGQEVSNGFPVSDSTVEG